MDMSVPYNPAVVNLSLSDPNCIDAGDSCNAYYAAQNASQAAVSWAYQFEYGHWATYYYIISKTPRCQIILFYRNIAAMEEDLSFSTFAAASANILANTIFR
jgi:hypothetical protein